MSGTRVVRQHCRVELPDSQIEVNTNVVDHRLYASLAKKNGWPSQSEDPVGYLAFVTWSAARRSGVIEPSYKFEKWVEDIVDVVVYDPEPVDPTEPAPGTG